MTNIEIGKLLLDYKNGRIDYSSIKTAVDRYSSNLIMQLPPTFAVTRVEVIDQRGRSYVNWNNKNSVEVQLQDESRTMKIFISHR